MTITFKIKSPTIMPNLDKIKDEAVKDALKDINKIIQDTVRDVSDDLHSLTEEGDWTAAFVCGTSGTITINDSFKTGAYVKIGRMVTVTGLFTVTSVSSPVGELALSGLPFTCGDADKYFSSVSVRATGLETTGATTIAGNVNKNTKNIILYHFADGSIANMAADVKAGSQFLISATYFTE